MLNFAEQDMLPRINDYLHQHNLTTADFRSIEELEREQSISEKCLAEALAGATQSEFVADLSNQEAVAGFAEKVPIGLARGVGMILVQSSVSPDPARLLICNVTGLRQLDHLRRLFRTEIEIAFAEREKLIPLINKVYESRQTKTHEIIESIELPDANLESIDYGDDLLNTDGQAPIINLVNSALFDAVSQRASDVHFQPYEDRLVIRFRIDGILFDIFTVPKKSQEEVLSRVKVIGKINIAEKRLPQDGRATVQVGNKRVDLRIASLPTSDGERIVVRLLDKSAELYSLTELGMDDELLGQFRKLIHREHGMILVTGPTGGGKSTTLYAALQEINTKDKNVVTLEDPIEYQLPGISQTQVSEKKGLTFAKGLRNVLRQDPDIIMVGEIRDQETAEMAIQSALTGHLVFSTLHTNDATSSITRLVDLGVEPYLVASSVIGVLAQRLVRRICSYCKHEVPVKSQDPDRLGQKWYREMEYLITGRGCNRCRETGFAGRIGVFEMLQIDEPIRELIIQQKSSAEIRSHSQHHSNMKSLSADGIIKICNGESTVDEIFRIASNF